MALSRRDLMRLSAAVAGAAVVEVAGESPAGALSRPGVEINPLGVLSGSVGYLNLDLNPASGALGSWGTTGTVLLDYQCRSIGVDLGSSQAVNQITLTSTATGTRIEKPDLSLYTSTDNVTYSKVADWDFLKIDSRIILFNFTVTTRYLKVHGHLNDTAGAFGNGLQQLMQAACAAGRQWTADGGGAWNWRKSITVQNPNAVTMNDRAVYVTKAALGVAGLITDGKLQSDLRDVRFADSADRELQFYTDDNGFFVRMNSLLAGPGPSGSATIYFYYGNPLATYRGGGREALQVEYGNLTVQTAASGNFGANIKPVRLPNGTMMLVGGTTSAGGICARYSTDGGHTWGAPEALVSAGTRAGVSTDSPGGLIVDPVTGAVLLIFFSFTRYSATGGNALDPAQCLCELYTVQATSYALGKPVFGLPAKVTGIYTAGGAPINYAGTYGNPVKLANGDFLAAFYYVCRANGGSAVSVLRSTDGGATWAKSSSELTLPGSGAEKGPSETALVQLANGTCRLYMRQQVTDKYYFAVSTSTDNGVTWSAMSDSEILSTNTTPALSRHSNGDALFTWSGHCAMAMDAYFRNDITVAYSSDDTASWHGYRDLLRKPQLKTEADWYGGSGEPFSAATEVDKAATTNGDYVFAWSSPTTVAILEDFDRYLYRSHGALDRFQYSSATIPGAGTPPSPRPLPVSASRIFPAVRQGRIRFKVKPANLGGSLYFALQEGFNRNWDGPGSAFLLRLAPTGELQYSTTAAYHTKPRYGWVDNDTAPGANNITLFDRSVLFAFDYHSRSVGVDLRQSRTISTIQLFDTDATNRLTAGDLAVYVSANNDDDWTSVTGWTFTNSGGTITLGNVNAVGRFVKVHQLYGDTAFTFANYTNRILRVTTVESEPAVPFSSLTSPTTLSLNSWHTIQLDVDLPSGSVGVSADGTARGSVPQAHSAEAVAHLWLGYDEGTSTEVYLDELIVQDTSLALPTLSGVGVGEAL